MVFWPDTLYTFHDLAKQGARVNDNIQLYSQGTRGITRRRRRFNNYSSGPRCPMCNSTDVQPFSAIYGFGTTTFFGRRGLIIPSHFERMKRQTVLAAKCTPPSKMPWWPAILSLIMAGAFQMTQRVLPRISDLLELGGYWMLWVALGFALVAALHNFVYYPSHMAAWGRKLLCQKCGTAFEAQAQG